MENYRSLARNCCTTVNEMTQIWDVRANRREISRQTSFLWSFLGIFRYNVDTSMVLLLTLLLVFVSFGNAASTSRDRTTSGPPIVSQQQAQDWLHLWQKRLHLEDWKIDIKIVRIWELEQGTLGHIDWSVPHRTATIKVLNSADYELPKDKIPSDVELSIVHELVHLHLSVLPLNKSTRGAEEQVVTMLADALVDLEHNHSPTE